MKYFQIVYVHCINHHVFCNVKCCLKAWDGLLGNKASALGLFGSQFSFSTWELYNPVEGA